MISVIVPVYNVEKYIDKCIQSIYYQTYINFECLLIDDGSTDGSSAICDTWAKKDNRIKVFHTKNQGVSAARNLGLKYSSGEFITFIDSDDYVDSDYLDSLIKMTFNKADLYIIGLSKFYADGSISIHQPRHNKCFLLNESNIELFIDLNYNYLLYGPVAKLYLSTIIKTYNIIFPTNFDYGEDLIFNYQYLTYVNSISCKNISLYHYRILNNFSTLSSKKRNNQFDIDYYQWNILKNFYISRMLWCNASMQLLYNRLWGIIYDSLFNDNALTYNRIKQILSIPEINELKTLKNIFVCSNWIKFAIIHRYSIIFKLLNIIKNLCK